MRRLFFLSNALLFLFALNMCGGQPEETTTAVPETTTTTVTTAEPTATTALVTTTGAMVTTTTLAPATTLTTVAPTTAAATTTLTIPATTAPPTTTSMATSTTTIQVTTIISTTMTASSEITTESEFIPIADLLSDQPTGSVKIRGVVYYTIPTPVNPSYYVYDGTGYIIVLDDNPVSVGEGVELTAEFDYSGPVYVPQLIDVTQFSQSTQFTTLPLYPDMSIANIVLHQKTDFEFYGRTLTVTGVVGSEGPNFMLSSGELKVILNGKAFLSGNPFLTLVGQTVTIRVVVHFYDETSLAWHVLYNSAYGIGE